MGGRKGVAPRPAGWHHIPEAKAKIAVGARGRVVSIETREKIRLANLGNQNGLGKTHTLEEREHISQRMKGNKHGQGNVPSSQSIAALRAYGQSAKGRAAKSRRSRLQMLGTKQSPETIAKRFAWYQKDPERKEAHNEHLRYQRRKMAHKTTDIERILENFLRASFPDCLLLVQQPIAHYTVDFALPKYRLVFEADGEYWHQDGQKEGLRDAVLRHLRWEPIHILGKELQSLGTRQARQDQKEKVES